MPVSALPGAASSRDTDRIAAAELQQLAVRDRGAHHIAARLRTDDQHRLAGGHQLVFLGQAPQHHAIGTAP